MYRSWCVAVTLCLVSASGPSAQQAPATKPGERLSGLWGSESVLGPQVRGTIAVRQKAGVWTLQTGGFEMSARVNGDDVRLVLPGGQGEFRARTDAGAAAMRGFWIQPPGNLGQFVTPVTLEQVTPHAWRGTLAPLDESFSLYLSIQPQPDGTLRGALRNPEMNWNGRAPWFRVAQDGETVTFVDPASGKARFVQPYDAGDRRITFDFGAPVVLTPRGQEEAVGFYPRSTALAPYVYRAPIQDGDGWATARAGDVGLDEASLQAFVRHVVDMDPAADRTPRIHSLLVARHGKLVLEEYFFGFTADRLHDLRSASKTFTSVMAGVAMDRGARFSMETPVATIFPRIEGAAPTDPRASRITVGHLLTHSSGLACDDNDEASPGHEDVMQQQRVQRDWYRFALDLPMAHDPGTTYAYCSAGINLVGGVVARSTGSWLPAFFDQYVARPLQIGRYAMNLMPSGDAYAGGGVYLRPRDFLKFGQTYLAGGLWNGRRIVSPGWVQRSTGRQIDVPNGSTDGFGWHRYVLSAGGRSYQEYEASGNGGQFLMVVPELDLTVVITAGNYNEYAVWKTFRDDLVPRYVLTGAGGAGRK